MGKIFYDENGNFGLNYTDAVWATDKVGKYNSPMTSGFLGDVDWVLETEEYILLVEYKNSNLPDAQKPDAFNPEKEDKIKKIARKYYDTLHYLDVIGKIHSETQSKSMKYVYVVDVPHGDSVLRNRLRYKIAQKLPFKLQKEVPDAKKTLLDEFLVCDIREWNKNFPQFPLEPTEKYLNNLKHLQN